MSPVNRPRYYSLQRKQHLIHTISSRCQYFHRILHWAPSHYNMKSPLWRHAHFKFFFFFGGCPFFFVFFFNSVLEDVANCRLPVKRSAIAHPLSTLSTEMANREQFYRPNERLWIRPNRTKLTFVLLAARVRSQMPSSIVAVVVSAEYLSVDIISTGIAL